MRNIFHITICLVTLHLFILEINGKTNTSDNRNKRIRGPKLRGNVASNINLPSDKKGKIIRGSNDQLNKNSEDVLEQGEKLLVSENVHNGLHKDDSPKETIFIKEDQEGQIHSELNPESSEDSKDLNDNHSKDESSDIISGDNKSHKEENHFQSLSDLELIENSSQDNLESEKISTESFSNQKQKGLNQEVNEEPLEPFPTKIYKEENSINEENSKSFPKQENKKIDNHNEKNVFHENVSVNINQENLKPQSFDENLNINSKILEDQLDLHEHDNSEHLKDEKIGNEEPVHENLSIPNDSIEQILNHHEQESNVQEQLYNEKQNVEEKKNYQISSVDLKELTNEDILPNHNPLENIKQNESEINHVQDHVLPKENIIDKFDNQKDHIDQSQHIVNVLQENNINNQKLEPQQKPNIESFEPKNIDLEIIPPENVGKEEIIVDVPSPKHSNHETFEEGTTESEHEEVVSEKSNPEKAENEGNVSQKSNDELDENEFVESEKSKPEPAENEESILEEDQQEEILSEQTNHELNESKLVDNEEDGFEEANHEEFSSEQNDSELNENELVESEKNVSEPSAHEDIVSENSVSEPAEHEDIVSEKSNNEPAEHVDIVSEKSNNEPAEHVEVVSEQNNKKPSENQSGPVPSKSFEEIERVDAQPKIVDLQIIEPNVVDSRPSPQESVEPPFVKFEKVPSEENKHGSVDPELEEKENVSEVVEEQQNQQESVEEIPLKKDESEVVHPEIIEIEKIEPELEFEEIPVDEDEFEDVQPEQLDLEHKNVDPEIVEVEEILPEIVEIEDLSPQSNNNENIELIKPEEKKNELSVVQEKAIPQEPVEPTLNENEEVVSKTSEGDTTKPDILQIKIVQENKSNKKETPVVDGPKHVEESIQEDDNDDIDFEGLSRKDDEKDSSNKNKKKSSFITYISTKKFKKVSETIVGVMINAYDGVTQVVSTIKGIAKDIVIFFQNI